MHVWFMRQSVPVERAISACEKGQEWPQWDKSGLSACDKGQDWPQWGKSGQFKTTATSMSGSPIAKTIFRNPPLLNLPPSLPNMTCPIIPPLNFSLLRSPHFGLTVARHEEGEERAREKRGPSSSFEGAVEGSHLLKAIPLDIYICICFAVRGIISVRLDGTTILWSTIRYIL